jgi:hypothetical protein
LNNEIFIFSESNFLAQLSVSKYENGLYKMKFYSEVGRPSSKVTKLVEEYLYYPSGGTIRDTSFNIIEYFPKFDTYRGFKPPHLQERK